MKKDYYAIFGVPPTASHEEIKKAKYQWSRLFHRDRLAELDEAGRKLAEVKLAEINDAFDTIGNPEKRRCYDREVEAEKSELRQQQEQERVAAEKKSQYQRIQELFERGDVEGAVREAKSLYVRFPSDTDCQNNYAALVYEWAKNLAEKGDLEGAAAQLRLAAERALDAKLKSRIRADLELLRAKGRWGSPPGTSSKPTDTAPPPPYSPTKPTPPPPAPPSFTAEEFWNHVATAIRAARLIWKLKRQQIIVLLMLGVAVGVAYGGVALHKSLLAKTTLSFGFSVDGKGLPSGEAPVVLVDGQTFSSGNRIGLGPHKLLVQLQDAELFQKHIWVFYGTKNMGTLPLESSKGSLFVMVNPSPATIILQREGEVVRQGGAPLKMDKLSVGDYTLIIQRGEYEEVHSANIQREQQTKMHIDLNLGSIGLSSFPLDAEFDLSGNGRHWQGKLPIHIIDVPVGTYHFIAQRNGWELDENVTVGRGMLTTNKIEFQYGSIEVTSEPTGLIASTNGVEIGKTPTILRELKPGQYELTVTDGENDLMANVNVGPKEKAKYAFALHYGNVQLSSDPPGATVFRKGKEVGKTPLTLAHIPTERTALELRLDGYGSTNVPIFAQEGLTTNYTVKLFSKRYLAAMNGAHLALEANEFELAGQCVAKALESEPADSSAAALQTEINQRADKWKRQQLEAKRLAAEDKAKQLAAGLAAIPMLNPENIIKNCWNTPPKSESAEYVDLVDVAKTKPLALPIWAATDIICAGIEVIAWPINKLKTKKQPRFSQGYFINNYQNHDYRYYGNIASVDVKNNTITLTSGGTTKESYAIVARLRDQITKNAFLIKPGSKIWVSGQLIALAEIKSSGPAANRLVLDNSKIYAPNTLPASK